MWDEVLAFEGVLLDSVLVCVYDSVRGQMGSFRAEEVLSGRLLRIVNGIRAVVRRAGRVALRRAALRL